MILCKLSEFASTQATESVARLLDGGRIELYSGDIPGSPDERVGTQPMLVRIPLGDPAFSEPKEGRAMATKTWESYPADGSGEARWFRAYTKNGKSVMDGSVEMGTGGDLNLNDTSVKRGTLVVVRAFSFRAG